MLGVWMAPVMAQLMITLFGMDRFPVMALPQFCTGTARAATLVGAARLPV